MDVQAIVNDLKGKAQPYVSKGQKVVNASVTTLKQANGIVASGVESLAKTQFEAGKDLFAAAQSSFAKAKADGIKAVAASPATYLPEGRERVLSAYNDSVVVVSKTSEKLTKVLKLGVASVTGKGTRPARKSPAKTAPKKTAARKSARKTHAVAH
jgi:hypothetical protein